MEIRTQNSAIHQYFTAFVVNLLTIVFGMLEGWSSPNIILLTSSESPLPTGKITLEEASWVTSLFSVGALICNFFFGCIANNFGRKIPLLVISVPMIICLLLLWFSQNVFYLYASRLMGGFFGGGGFMLVPMFLSEIADDCVRGTLLSTLVLAQNVGFLLSYLIGNYLDFYAFPQIMIILIVAFAILLLRVPESPAFLVKRNKIAEAKESIRFYKNMRKSPDDEKAIELEIGKLTFSLGENQNGCKQRVAWTNETIAIARNAFAIATVLVVLNIFNGVVPMSFYTASIFQETGSNLSPNMSAIVIGAIQVFGTCLATRLVERSGRKILIVASSIGTAISLIVLGTYTLVKLLKFEMVALNWIPVASFSSATFISSLGIQSLTLTVVSEIMPEKIKETYMSYCMTLLWSLNFISAKYLPLFIEILEFHGCMYVFAGICLICSLYIILYITRPTNYSKYSAVVMRKPD